MKNLLKTFLMSILILVSGCGEDDSSKAADASPTNSFNGVWVRTGPNVDETDDVTEIAIGNIPEEPENRVYMCEKQGSNPGLYKGTIEGNVITWDEEYNIPNTHLRKVGEDMEFSYPSVFPLVLPTMYSRGTWSGDCASLGRPPGIYFSVTSESPILSYQDNNPLILNNLSPGTSYGPCSPGVYDFGVSFQNGEIYEYGEISTLSGTGEQFYPNRYTLSPPAAGFTHRNYQLRFFFSVSLNRWLRSFTYVDETTADCANSTLAVTVTTNGVTATANVTGGVAPYQYTWSNGQSTSSLSNLANGNYTVSITDSEGCQREASASIQVSAANAGTVTIGSQIWMLRNLDVDRYRNGDIIPYVQDEVAWANLTTGAWCYLGIDTAWGPVYGKLYNWYAVNDSRGLAPTGYHIPSDAEWTQTTTFLGGDLIAGGKMKETGNLRWQNNVGATNSSGFTALPGNRRVEAGVISGNGGFWWTSTQSSVSEASSRIMVASNTKVTSYNSNKFYGYSVRCIKD